MTNIDDDSSSPRAILQPPAADVVVGRPAITNRKRLTDHGALTTIPQAPATTTKRHQLVPINESSSPRAILRPPAAAVYTGLTTSTLAKRRVRGESPHFVKLGKKSVGYHLADLDAWLADNRRASTSAYLRRRNLLSHVQK